jgi:hypothetical protein
MIYFLPIGDERIASSRLRVYQIQPFLEDSNIGVPDKYKKGDVLIIQKIPAIEELQKAKSKGVKVIYDIDDYYWDNPQFMKMIDEADLITTDTEKKKEMLLTKWNNGKEMVVIPDSLDWDGTIKEIYEHNGIIGWTGYGNNSVYLKDIKESLPFSLRLITSPDWHNYLPDPECKIQMRPWSLDMVDKYLAECDLGIYYLPKGDFETCKGEHKLLKNWAIGLPTYTSRMPAYVEAMKEAGLGEKYLVDDWSKLKDISTKEDIKKMKEYALKFQPEEVAKLWKKLL